MKPTKPSTTTTTTVIVPPQPSTTTKPTANSSEGWIKEVQIQQQQQRLDDFSTLLIPSSTATSSSATVRNTNTSLLVSLSSPSSASNNRVYQLLEIVFQQFLLPVTQGLLDAAAGAAVSSKFPTTWDEFWLLPLSTNITTTRTTTATTTTVAQQFTTLLETLGVTYVKFGQALSARPDIVPRPLAEALVKLQDQMDVDIQLQQKSNVQTILRNEWNILPYNHTTTNDDTKLIQQRQRRQQQLIDTLSEMPVAAASIGVVYSAMYDDDTKVCIKIQRPDIHTIVQQDAQLLRSLARLLESIPAVPVLMSSSTTSTANNDNNNNNNNNNNNKKKKNRFIQTNLTGAVDEFMSRITEELDYRNEAANIQLFGSLYSHRLRRNPTTTTTTRKMWQTKNNHNNNNNNNNNNIQVVVPQVYPELCTERVVVMEWIDGIKLVDLQRQRRQRQAVKHNNNNNDEDEEDQQVTQDLIRQGIDCTLSQLLDTGILHADPHGGNLLKVVTHENNNNNNNNKHDKYDKGRIKSSTATTPTYRLGYVDFGLLSTVPSTVQDGLVCAVAQLIFAKNVTAVANLFGELQLLPSTVLDDPSEREALSLELNTALSQVLVYNGDDIDTTDTTSNIPTLRFDKLLEVLSRLVPRFQFQLPPYFLNNARALGTLEGMAKEMDPSFNVLQSLYPFTIQRLLDNPSNSPVVDATLTSLVEDSVTGKIQRQKVQQLIDDASYYSGYPRRKIIKDVLKSHNGRRLVRRLVREQSMDAVRNVLWNGIFLRTMTNYFRL
ncbi:ABC1 family-domain containing protein [Nitzschia inconspicua]|uniref:ABC1 family-domain containing protein n=1 Tax=Nitzschia inconspicua TaxID=303405 RepID=A0A9K3Q3T6_9STRA|nr:ABC1 family-domain containing protein [Nitzschia inconspicua]